MRSAGLFHVLPPLRISLHTDFRGLPCRTHSTPPRLSCLTFVPLLICSGFPTAPSGTGRTAASNHPRTGLSPSRSTPRCATASPIWRTGSPASGNRITPQAKALQRPSPCRSQRAGGDRARVTACRSFDMAPLRTPQAARVRLSAVLQQALEAHDQWLFDLQVWQDRVRISVIVDACFSLIVDGVSA